MQLTYTFNQIKKILPPLFSDLLDIDARMRSHSIEEVLIACFDILLNWLDVAPVARDKRESATPGK